MSERTTASSWQNATTVGVERSISSGSGKRKSRETVHHNSPDNSSTSASHGRHRQSNTVEIFSALSPEVPQGRKRASSSHSGRRSSTSSRDGGTFPGILEAADSAASLMGDAPMPPRDTVTRRRNRSAANDNLYTSKGLDGELTLEEFSINTRRELLEDTSTIERNRSISGDRNGSISEDKNSMITDGKLASTDSKPTRPRKHSGGVDWVDDDSKQRRPSVQRAGSFKGPVTSSGLHRGSRDGSEGGKGGFQRGGSFRGGVSSGSVISGTSKDHQRNAHLSALKKQTTWIRASPAPSPKTSPQNGSMGFFSKLATDIFGGDKKIDPSPLSMAQQTIPPAPTDSSPDRPMRGAMTRESSTNNLTKQYDGSDYAGSNRPRDNIAPSDRLKASITRRLSTDKDASESSYVVRSSPSPTPETSVIYPKQPEKLTIARFKLDEGKKALEKRLLLSSAEAMHKFPGPHPETLNNVRKKTPTFFSLMDGMSLVTHNMVIGSRYDAEDLGALRKLGISYVLNITDRVPNFFPDVLIYHKIEIQDKPSVQLDQAFRSAAAFLQHVEANRGRVLIHCVAGVSRSVSIFLMYIMAFHHIKLCSLWYHVHSIRPYIGPNEGFCLQLALFEVEHLGALSVGKHTSKHWDFYGLNSILATLPKDYDTASATQQLQSECCVIQ